jgi:hypothetical protein
MGLADIALDVGRSQQVEVVDIVTFVESTWGLNQRLFPVQRIILKAHYGIALDDNVWGVDLSERIPKDHPAYADIAEQEGQDEGYYRLRVPITDWRRENLTYLTEAQYLFKLYEEGRCNIPEVIPGVERREMILAVGRRSGKTFLAACIAAYEIYKLINLQAPQGFYGLPSNNQIGIISVATDKDQAGLLYTEASGHFSNCFAAGTEVITGEGIQRIGDLAGTNPTLLTGNGSWVEAPVRSFGQQRLVKLTLTRQGVDKVIHCTGDHRWFAKDERKAYRGKGWVEFKTTDLRPGKHRLQQVFGRSYKNKVHPSPFGVAHGFTYGDGSTSAGQRHATSVNLVGEKDSHLQPYFDQCPSAPQPGIDAIRYTALPNFFRRLPDIRENHSYLLGWLMGYFAADGSCSSGLPVIASKKRSDIEFVRGVCAILGIGTYSIQEDTHANDWAPTGQHTMYRMALMRASLDESFFLIPAHRQSFTKHGGADVKVRNWVVKSVEETDRVEEVFCATVEGHGTFTLDGNIVTGNCAFFKPYTANNTMSYAKFQTPADIERFGRYADDPTAKATLKVSFKSCVAKGLRGPGNIVVILDELAHFNDAGQSDAKEIYGAVKPSTAAFSPKDPKNRTKAIGPVEGRMISISSPLGRQGHFYTLAQQALKGGLAAANKLFIQAPSWEVNITLEASFLEGEYASDPVAFFTEYGAQFLDATRGWIENANDLLACVNPEQMPVQRGIARRPHFIGIDLALVGDWTAVAIGHIETGGLIVVDLVDRIKAGVGKYEHLERLEFDDVADWIYDLSKRFYFAEGMFDQWAGIPFEQALNKRGLAQLKAVHHTGPLTSQMYQNFRDMMWDKRLVLYNSPVGNDGYCDYIRELLELQATYKSKYVMVVEAPNVADKYDDQGDAIVRMVWQASQQLGNRKYISKGTGAQRGPNDSTQDMQKAYAKARRRARFGGGTSMDRQRSLINRGSTRGKR